MRAHIVAGMGFGDEGKGRTTEYLCSRYDAGLVVRYNGGPQALHHVVREDGEVHGFSQFGSGTFLGAKTFLSKFTLVEPRAIAKEAEVLKTKGIQNPLAGLTVDPQCIVITPYQRLANKIREERRGDQKHGSVGWGIGETREDELKGGLKLTAGCLVDRTRPEVLDRLRAIKDRKISQLLKPKTEYTELEATLIDLDPEDVYNDFLVAMAGIQVSDWQIARFRQTDVIFEGAQGVLLDEAVGYQPPHVTWTNCLFDNALTLCHVAGIEDIEKVGVFRTYHTRHGAGPFPTERPAMFNYLPEEHNRPHPWMGGFRIGAFDWDLADYAIGAAKPDVLAFTHADRHTTPHRDYWPRTKYLSRGQKLNDMQETT